MKIGFAVPAASSLAKATGVLVAAAFADKTLGPAAKELDALAGGAIARAVKNARFSGKKGEIFGFPAPSGLTANHVLLFGLGDPDKLDANTAEEAGGTVMGRLQGLREKGALVLAALPGDAKMKPGNFAAHFAFGAHLRSYRFDKYRTKEKPEDKPVIAEVMIALKAAEEAKKRFAPLAGVAEGIFLTRDVVSEPPNVIYPETLAQRAKTLTRDGVKVEVLDVPAMRKLGMGALLGVGQGSVRDARLVVMQWNGGKKGAQPVAFIGKGVTFDTGGISIKPAKGMEDMKWDMAGAGTVIGLMKALAKRKAKVNAVGIVGLVENMPDGNAQRPGDVVTSMSGQTIEVLNTDAEGRLVLADAMWYCQDRFKPKFMVDLATLTGAIIMALGTHRAGLFSNNDKLADHLKDAGSVMGEQLWRMPLGPEYDKMINSQIADVANIGDGGAGSVTAAQFLQRFVNDVPWAHLDIAGTAWSKRDTAMVPKGATAFGLRLLDRMVAEHYEGR
jgi:leucyl aminopeptidase